MFTLFVLNYSLREELKLTRKRCLLWNGEMLKKKKKRKKERKKERKGPRCTFSRRIHPKTLILSYLLPLPWSSSSPNHRSLIPSQSRRFPTWPSSPPAHVPPAGQPPPRLPLSAAPSVRAPSHHRRPCTPANQQQQWRTVSRAVRATTSTLRRWGHL